MIFAAFFSHSVATVQAPASSLLLPIKRVASPHLNLGGGNLDYTNNTKIKRSEEFPLSGHSYLRLYFVQVDLGTPAQTFDVLIDTGSTALWVPMMNGTSKAHDQRRSRDIGYLSSSVNVEMYGDTFRLGDHEVRNQLFGAATRVGPHANGIMKMSRGASSSGSRTNAFHDPKKSSLILGGPDSKITRNGFTWHENDNCTTDGFCVTVDSILCLDKYGNKNCILQKGINYKGVLDTGTTPTLIDRKLTSALNNLLGDPGNGRVLAMPLIVFVFNGEKFRLSVQDYTVEENNICWNSCYEQSSLDGSNQINFGTDIFFRNIYYFL
ncbi:pepsin A [Schizosaccharomyces cryophilus OY26]|uniref:Pepsin A n=1 Tax=Schizosaccharomyces cryophilus (strain OY26 / ATCC MYA-4695 / CBS 11777 / NBRC 106824 / NRRL Y48691) TaxID=653667 RepID=S9W574_SCHCR|nr:pepsin A [Schizosaccharomyces cryophilus OY26]EPY53080.1 pepsin A [Schizosaccharomyces cryophilus OY26]